MILKYKNEKYLNIRQVLNQEFNLSSRLILKLKKSYNIYLNDEPTFLDKSISLGDTVSVNIDFIEDNSNIIPTKMELKILYEDDFLLILDKPAGIPVHPSMEHFTDSLSNGVKYHFDSINLHRKIRPINRLDRNTSGIVLFAKNEYIQECLAKQMQNDEFVKEYIAICTGIFKKKSGIIDFPIARKNNSIIEREVSPNGEYAITNYKILKEFNNMSELLIRLKTGRTHQIRVHMSYIGHSLLGDDLYGEISKLINRQALHAYHVKFKHPVSKETIDIYCEIPLDMKLIIE